MFDTDLSTSFDWYPSDDAEIYEDRTREFLQNHVFLLHAALKHKEASESMINALLTGSGACF